MTPARVDRGHIGHDRASTRRDRGQASVELALCLPVVMVLALGLLQVVLIVRDQLAVDLAAREGARHAAVAADPWSAAQRAVHGSLDRTGIEIDVAVDDRTVRVTVGTAPTQVPFIGAVVNGRRLTGTVTMALEPAEP